MSEQKIVGGVIVSHGRVANELLTAAETVVGKLTHIEAVSIGWQDNVESARDEIAKSIKRVSTGNGVILLTDMFGGTPSNLSISIMDEANVEVIAGVNLPMLIKLATIRAEVDLAKAVDLAKEAGRKYISVASQVLAVET